MKALVWATIDTLSNLLLVILVAINPPVIEARAAIDTPGRWVATLAWAASDNDLDLWMQQPDGRKVFWRNPRSQLAHLEQDDQGYAGETHVGRNLERLVLRAIDAGEYIFAVHAYSAHELPIRATVTLWRLQGADRKVYSGQITVVFDKSEQTAFRLRLDANGALQDLNHLPARIVSE